MRPMSSERCGLCVCILSWLQQVLRAVAGRGASCDAAVRPLSLGAVNANLLGEAGPEGIRGERHCFDALYMILLCCVTLVTFFV